MSPEWVPLLFAAIVGGLLLVLLRPRERTVRFAIWRTAAMETAYLGTAYLLVQLLDDPPVEVLMGSMLAALIVGLVIPNRVYHKLAGGK